MDSVLSDKNSKKNQKTADNKFPSQVFMEKRNGDGHAGNRIDVGE